MNETLLHDVSKMYYSIDTRKSRHIVFLILAPVAFSQIAEMQLLDPI